MKLHESLRTLTEGIRHIGQVCRDDSEEDGGGLRRAYWKLYQVEEVLREVVKEIEANGGNIEGPGVRWMYDLGDGGGSCSR